MPSYAILGSTGNNGLAVLKVLLQSSDNQVHAYCRSKAKLHKLLPETADNSQVQVFEGSLKDTELLANCMSGTRATFVTIAAPGNQPGCTVVQDAAHDIISALEKLNARGEQLPKLILTSSASTEHRLMSDMPKLMRDMIYRAFSSVYDDLKQAERIFRAKESLVSMTFVKPGALCNDTQKGHVLSLESAKSPVSFLDLAAGMVEIADEGGDRYDMKSVAVNAKAKDVAFPWEAPFKLFWGLLFHFLPWLYRFLG